MEKTIGKTDLIMVGSGGIGQFVEKKGSGQRFAIVLQYATGAVLGLLLDVVFVLFVLWGTTRTRH
jgi:uncharacterized membrane protein YoaK (UPF0700 family)